MGKKKYEKNNWLARNDFLHRILNLLKILIFRDLQIIHIEAMVNVKLLLYKNHFTYLQKCPESVDETHISRKLQIEVHGSELHGLFLLLTKNSLTTPYLTSYSFSLIKYHW